MKNPAKTYFNMNSIDGIAIAIDFMNFLMVAYEKNT
jgi:hypothetical protein